MDYGECVFDRFVQHVIKIPIGFIYLICGVLSSQNNDIVTYDDEISYALDFLNFSYKFFIRKHFADNVISIVAHVNETGLVFDA